MQNYTAALSRDGRFAAAATFTSDVKVGHQRRLRGWGEGRVGRGLRAPQPLRVWSSPLPVAFSPAHCSLPSAPPSNPWPAPSNPYPCPLQPLRADVRPRCQVYEIGHDRLGSFTGIRKAMDLKGHRSRVLCLDFSPDLTKMVTGSADGKSLVQDVRAVDLCGCLCVGCGVCVACPRHQ